MELKQLDQQVTVSALCGPESMAELAAAGVEVLVCNRTETEAAGLPTFVELEQAARAEGMDFVAIPFARGQMTREQCEEFRQLLDSGRRVHAFCRTGNRSCNLWAGARSMAGDDQRQLVDRAREAGFDVSGAVVTFGP